MGLNGNPPLPGRVPAVGGAVLQPSMHVSAPQQFLACVSVLSHGGYRARCCYVKLASIEHFLEETSGIEVREPVVLTPRLVVLHLVTVRRPAS